MVHFLEAVVRLAVLVLHRISDVSDKDVSVHETSYFMNDAISSCNETIDLADQFERQASPERPCPDLIPSSGPYVEFPVRSSCGFGVPPGTRCSVGCLPNYQLLGSCSRVCLGSGEWSGYESQCINRNIRCPDLRTYGDQPPNSGRKKRQSSVFATPVDPSSCLPFAGAVCRLRCPSNYIPQGELKLVCLDNGQYDASRPQCLVSGNPTPYPTDGPYYPPTQYPPTQYPPRPSYPPYPGTPATWSPPPYSPDPNPSPNWPPYPPYSTLPNQNPNPPYPTPPNQNPYTPYPPGPNPYPTPYPPYPPGPNPNPTPYPPYPTVPNPIPYPQPPPDWTDPPVTVVPPPITVPTGPTNYPTPPPTRYPTPPTYYPTPSQYPTPYPTAPSVYPPDPSNTPVTDATMGPANRCFDLNPPSFGSVSGQCVNVFYGQMCIYKCNIGYGLVGASVLTCGSDGWSSSPPVCLPLLCKNQTAPAHGRLEGTCSPGFGGASCTLICDVGYKLTGLQNDTDVTGSITIACNNDHSWAREFPRCTPITCSSLPTVIPYGAIQPGSQCAPGIALRLCSYQCVRGYAITGSSSALLCQLDGTFSAGAPSCTRILCPGIPPVANATLTGQCSPGYAYETCSVKCDRGFDPPNQQVECQANGTFNATVSPCKRIECPRLTFINAKGIDGTADNNGNTIQSNCNPGYAAANCSVECSPGFNLPDNTQMQLVKCDEKGNWLSYPERCNPVYCKPKAIPEFATASKDCTKGDFNSKCTIQCPQNYWFPDMYKKKELTCGPDGNWTGDWPAQCVRMTCTFENVTNPIEHGMRSGSGCTIKEKKQIGLAGDCCTYSCQRGYALRGNPVVNCKDPNMPVDMTQPDGPFQAAMFDLEPESLMMPVCTLIYCPTPPKLPEGFWYQCSGNTVGTMCKINSTLCKRPYKVGVDFILCDDTGKWSSGFGMFDVSTVACAIDSNIKTCEAGIFVNAENGKFSGYCSPGYLGFECELLCDAGFRPFRDKTRRCMLNPEGNVDWDYRSKPFCIPQLCPGITVPSNADASGQCAPGIPAQSCTISCRPGYRIAETGLNEVTLTCLADGMFDMATPRCARALCPPLSPPLGGSMSTSCSSANTGDICSFSCPPGFYPNGPNIVCTASGQWSGNVPACLSPDGRPPNPRPGPPTVAPPVTNVPTNRPKPRPPACRPLRICCPLLVLRKPFLTVSCPSSNSLFLPEVGTSCSLRCSRGELIDGSSRPQRRKIVPHLKHNDQRQELFTKKLIHLICSRNSQWIGGDVNRIRCSNGLSSMENSSSRPNKHPERPQVHVRPWFNVKTNETRLIVSDH